MYATAATVCERVWVRWMFELSKFHNPNKNPRQTNWPWPNATNKYIESQRRRRRRGGGRKTSKMFFWWSVDRRWNAASIVSECVWIVLQLYDVCVAWIWAMCTYFARISRRHHRQLIINLIEISYGREQMVNCDSLIQFNSIKRRLTHKTYL